MCFCLSSCIWFFGFVGFSCFTSAGSFFFFKKIFLCLVNFLSFWFRFVSLICLCFVYSICFLGLGFRWCFSYIYLLMFFVFWGWNFLCIWWCFCWIFVFLVSVWRSRLSVLIDPMSIYFTGLSVVSLKSTAESEGQFLYWILSVNWISLRVLPPITLGMVPCYCIVHIKVLPSTIDQSFLFKFVNKLLLEHYIGEYHFFGTGVFCHSSNKPNPNQQSKPRCS